MTYAKTYTRDTIALTGRNVAGTVYLQLTFNYGYYTPTLDGGKRYMPLTVSTGLTVDERYWERDPVTKEWGFSAAYIRSHRKDHDKAIKTIGDKRDAIWTAYNAVMKRIGCKPSPSEVMDELKGEARIEERIHLSEYVRDYAKREYSDSPLSAAKYRTVADVLDAMEHLRTVDPFKDWAWGSGKLYLDSFNENDWHDFTVMFQRAACGLGDTIKDRGIDKVRFVGPHDPSAQPFYSQTTLEKFQQCLRSVLNHARKTLKKRKLSVIPSDLEKVQRKSFQRVALRPDEIARIIEARFDGYLENARQLFVVQLLTGVPVGNVADVLAAKIHTIHGESISFPAIYSVRTKTNTPIVIPVFAPVLAILESQDKPHAITQQKYNGYLKEICLRLGIDRPFHVTEQKANGTMTSEVEPTYSLVSTHTARRSWKTMAEKTLRITRELVCDMMGHAYEDKSADRTYKVMTPEERTEELVTMAQLREHRLSFPLVVLRDRPATMRRA